jgi:hypothetical protein
LENLLRLAVNDGVDTVILRNEEWVSVVSGVRDWSAETRQQGIVLKVSHDLSEISIQETRGCLSTGFNDREACDIVSGFTEWRAEMAEAYLLVRRYEPDRPAIIGPGWFDWCFEITDYRLHWLPPDRIGMYRLAPVREATALLDGVLS